MHGLVRQLLCIAVAVMRKHRVLSLLPFHEIEQSARRRDRQRVRPDWCCTLPHEAVSSKANICLVIEARKPESSRHYPQKPLWGAVKQSVDYLLSLARSGAPDLRRGWAVATTGEYVSFVTIKHCERVGDFPDEKD